jgi:hypothetical protein
MNFKSFKFFTAGLAIWAIAALAGALTSCAGLMDKAGLKQKVHNSKKDLKKVKISDPREDKISTKNVYKE